MGTRATIVACLALLTACGDETVQGSDAGTDATATADSTADSAIADATVDDGTASADSADATASADSVDASDAAGEVDDSPLGGERPARVVMPPDYDPARAWPLVLLLHGYSASGAIQDLYLGFSDTAKAAGFITVIPDGLKNALGNQYWNASPGWCCDFEHSGVDDDGYLVGLVAEAKARWHVDPARVFAFGHSNGGFMAHELACHHADLFAAIASLAGSLPIAVNDCNPSQPVSVLQIHGTLDAVIVYPGNADYPGAEAVVDRWASYDECSGQRVAGDPRDYDSAVAGLEATPWAWASCASDTEVALWSLAGSGHIPVVLGGPMIGDALGWFLTHPKTAPPAR